MRFEDYLTIIRRNLALLIVLTLVGCIVGLGVTLVQTPKYRSTASVFVSTQQATNLNDLTQGSLFAQEAVKNYADVVTTPLVLQPALDSLRMHRSARALALQVDAENPLDTTVLNISVTDTSPVVAARLANAIEHSLAKVVTTLTPPTADSVAPVQLVLLESAVASPRPATPDAPRNLGVGALVGLAVAVLVMLFRNALARRAGAEPATGETGSTVQDPVPPADADQPGDAAGPGLPPSRPQRPFNDGRAEPAT